MVLHQATYLEASLVCGMLSDFWTGVITGFVANGLADPLDFAPGGSTGESFCRFTAGSQLCVLFPDAAVLSSGCRPPAKLHLVTTLAQQEPEGVGVPQIMAASGPCQKHGDVGKFVTDSTCCKLSNRWVFIVDHGPHLVKDIPTSSFAFSTAAASLETMLFQTLRSSAAFPLMFRSWCLVSLLSFLPA